MPRPEFKLNVIELRIQIVYMGEWGMCRLIRLLPLASISMAIIFVSISNSVVFSAGPPLTFVEVQKNGVGLVDGLNNIRNLTVSPDGKNVYTARDGLAVFSRNATTGALTWLAHRPPDAHKQVNELLHSVRE